MKKSTLRVSELTENFLTESIDIEIRITVPRIAIGNEWANSWVVVG